MLKSIDRLKNKTYVGYTSDLQKRLFQHNNNKGAKSTKGYKWIIIYKKKFLTKSKALSYEFKLKKDKKKRSEILKNNEAKT
jgi:putative endonuclease